MIYDIDIAKQIANSLLQIKAIILQPDNPFMGWMEFLYIVTIENFIYPQIRTHIKQGLAAIAKQEYKGADLIAGAATAGSSRALVAEELGLLSYTRSKAKHGKQNQIEGYYEKGDSVILVEDLISSGKSSIEAASSLKDEGVYVKGIISIFNYGFKATKNNFKKNNLSYCSLSDYETLLEQAIISKY